MKAFCLLFFILFCLAAISAQTPVLSALSGSVGGNRVIGYFAAFNSGDEEKLKAFFLENISPEALKERPVEPRLGFHRQLRGEFETVEVKRIVSVNDTEINILALSKTGLWVSYKFLFNVNTTKFRGFAIEQTEPPADAPKIAPAYSAPKSMKELLETTNQMFTDLTKADAFSGVAMIAKDDKPIFAKAYGNADAERKTANTVDTKFNIGSINKDFTRIAIGQLIKQGKLSWDDKLIKILPDYPNREAAGKITIGQLVTMNSGIGDFVNDKYWAMDRAKLKDLEDYLSLFASEPLLFEPGTSKRYSNGGYIALGLVIEKLSGRSYYEYVRENIFKPAGMYATDSFFMNELPANTAYGYTKYHQKSRVGRGRNTDFLPARGSSAGGGYTTAADLLKFALVLKSKKLEIPDDQGRFPAEVASLGSAGGSEGVNALLETDPKTGYTVIVLSNYDGPSAEKPGAVLWDWLNKLKQ